MESSVFLAVIAAAVLHAAWNALVKGGKDKLVAMTAVVLGHVPIALTVLPFVPTPALASWPYLAGGIVLHVGYQFFLLYSYRIGDLTQVYPIARGSAPLLVALVSVVFLGVVLSWSALLAVTMIGGAVLSMSLVRQADGLQNFAAARLAFATGCFIAGYSLVDGIGARLAGSALGYYGFLTLGNAAVFAVFAIITRTAILAQVAGRAKQVFLVGGSASFLAYALVIWAFTQAPIALVAALRETSIVFALLIGVVVLKERLNLAKVLTTMVALLGAVVLRFSK